MFKDLGRSEIGFSKMGSDYFRISAVSDGGSGGTGGFGGFGDGHSSGKSEGSGGGGDWSLLSWYVFQFVLRLVLELFLFLWLSWDCANSF